MNKEKFLKELERKLAVLSEEERRDTINEYRDIIEEKVKHGKTEEEAVKEFGSISELAKEILSAYKINPDYSSKNETKEKTKQMMDDCEDFIKKGAQKLSDVTEEVIDNFKENGKDFTLETAFEIIIKVFIVLLLLAVLRIPFSLLSSFGSHLFGDTFSFFGDWIFRFGWKILIELVYLGVCVLLVLAAVNQYVKRTPSTSNHKKEPTKKPEVTKAEPVNEIKKEIPERKKKQPVNDTFGDVLLLLIKIFVVLVFLLPLWCCMFGFLIVIGFLVWMIIKGIAVWGFLIVMLGIFGMVSWITGIIYDALFRNKTPHVWPFFINFFLLLIGGFLSVDYITGFDYVNELPSSFQTETKIYEETITNELVISGNYKTFVIDEEVPDNQVVLKVTYYPDYVVLKRDEYNSSNGIQNLTFYTSGTGGWNLGKEKAQRIFDLVKDQKWYPFDELGEVKVEVHVNQATKDLVH